MRKLSVVLSALGLFALCAPALAQDASPWFLRAGVADLMLADGYTVSVGGGPISGAKLHYGPIYTPMAEIGYSFAPDWSAVATLGFPPAISASGAGSLAPYGKLESTTFGPSAYTIQYQPIHTGIVRPYIGAGLSYMIIFRMHDAVVQNAHLSNNLAPAFEVGSEFALDPQYGLFLEAKKAFLHSKTTGTVGGYPLLGTAALVPWVFSGGMTFHF